MRVGAPKGRRGWVGNSMKLVAADHSSSSFGEGKEKKNIFGFRPPKSDIGVSSWA